MKLVNNIRFLFHPCDKAEIAQATKAGDIRRGRSFADSAGRPDISGRVRLYSRSTQNGAGLAMKHTPASEAAVLVSMETLFAALSGALLLGERLPSLGWIGAALLFAASLLVQLAPRAKVI